MALLGVESADFFDTSTELDLRWGAGTGDWDPSTSAVRTGIRGLRKTSGANPNLRRQLAASVSTLVVGFAFRRPNIPSSEDIIVRFLETGTEHVSVRMNASTGVLTVSRNGTTLATSSATININIWYYIEFKATISDTVGTYELRVNGTNVASGSGADTRNGGTGVINQLNFGGATNTGDVDIDDIYWLDTSGSAPNNDFLGDVKVECILPNGNGNSSQFTGSDGDSIDNYLLVDENNLDTADYVQSTANDQIDEYTFGDLTVTTGTVYGVQINASALKTDAGAKSIALMTRRSGTDYASSDQALSTSQQIHSQIREQDPSTSAAWTISGVNAAEFGVKSRA